IGIGHGTNHCHKDQGLNHMLNCASDRSIPAKVPAHEPLESEQHQQQCGQPLGGQKGLIPGTLVQDLLDPFIISDNCGHVTITLQSTRTRRK
ncbi:MAG: hypothetical protein R3330_16690, partial [Saprospiraceae bacterium]|nr:hypothetical protein [Saprospiraceae bacterium]